MSLHAPSPRILSLTRPHRQAWDTVSNPQPPDVIQTQKNDLDSFIDASTAVQVQQIFEKMIVVWPWKDRMLTAWNLR
jgi:hypothetical protein